VLASVLTPLVVAFLGLWIGKHIKMAELAARGRRRRGVMSKDDSPKRRERNSRESAMNVKAR